MQISSSLPSDKRKCAVRFGICFLRVPLIYQPCCLVPCGQDKLGKLMKKVLKAYSTVYFVSS